MRLEARKSVPKGLAVIAAAITVLIGSTVYEHGDNPRKVATASLGVLVAGLFVGILWLVPGRIRISQQYRREAFLAIPRDDRQRGREYHNANRPRFYLNLVFGLAQAFVIGFTPVGSTVIRWAPGPAAVKVLGGIFILAVVASLTTLPLAAWAQHTRRRFLLSDQSWGKWAFDQLKRLLLGSVLAAILLTAVFFPMQLSADWWWLWAMALMTGVVLLFGVIFPYLIGPFFFKLKPLEDGEARTGVLALIKKSGVPLREVYVGKASAKGNEHNAGVAGLGPTKRMLIFDTLFKPGPEGATVDEVESVVGHELSHAKHEDGLLGTFVSIVPMFLAICGLYLLGSWTWLQQNAHISSATDVGAAALLLSVFTLMGIFSSPFHDAISRRMEAYADLYGLSLTGNVEAYTRSWLKMVKANLADPDPNRVEQALFFTHPSIVDRLALGFAYRDNARQ